MLHTALIFVILNITKVTKSMKLRPSWEAGSHSASQEFPCLFMEPEGSLPCSQDPATGTYPDPNSSSPHLPTVFLQGPL